MDSLQVAARTLEACDGVPGMRLAATVFPRNSKALLRV